MKKIFYSLLAVAALASCVKSEVVYTEDNSEIKIKPAASIATKANAFAAIDGTEYPTKENFDVYAYWNTDPAGSTFTEGTVYLGLNESAVEFTNKGNYWGGAANTYYWPKNGSLRFAAYSPSSVDMLHTLATDTYTADIEFTANTAETYDLLVAPTSKSYTSMTAAENVSVVFEHALSWITVKMVAKDAEAAKAFDVKKVTINDIVTSAALTAEMSKEGALKTEDKMTWDLSETTAPVVVFEGNQSVTAEPTVVETVANGTLVIPQATTTVTVEYTQNALAGTPALENQKVTVDLVLDKEDNPWKAGKHYVYTLVFGLDEILINPDVIDWEDVIVNDVEVGTTNVYSVEQLEAALAQGGKIVLQENIEATSLKASKDAVLDLNGKTITGTDNLTSSYALIEVQPDVTFTVEGEGKLTATASNNRGWGAFSSVLSNQRGTLIVNEGVEIEHLGGTDMAYGIDNLTNTGAQPAVTIVNGATVKSPYRAIRQFLNSTKANNELQVKAGSKIEGTNKSIWSQNANSGANPGKTVVEAGAELKGNVMLSAAGAAEWPVEVSIAASALVDGATVVPSNVPAGYAVVLADGVYTVVKGATGVATAEEFAAAVKQTAKNIEIILNADIEVAISTLGQITGGSGEYKLGGEETENFTIDLNGHRLTITTTYWSNLGAKNDNALFTIKNGTMDSSQATGTWNSYDLTFSNCDYVIENVVFEKAIAFDNAKKAVTLKNVTINEDHDYYAMWITAAGQNVTVDGLTINSDGRGIKIDEQYVGAPALVTLNVSNATFETKNKAAILVKSAAGANITLNNVDITKVEKDNFFHVWVDEDAAAYADKVAVNGGLCKVEGSAMAFAHSQAELEAAAVAGAYVYLTAGEYTLAKYPAGLTLVGAEDGVVFNATDKKYGVYGDVTIENVKVIFSNANYTGFQHTNNLLFNNCTIEGQPFLYSEKAVFESCTFEQASASAYNVWTYGAKNVEFNGCTFNCAGKSVLIYTESGDGQNVTFNNCALNASAPAEGKAAVEIDSSLIKGEYVVKINNTTDNGFAAGNVSGKTLWNHKKGSKATVIVDGVTVE